MLVFIGQEVLCAAKAAWEAVRVKLACLDQATCPGVGRMEQSILEEHDEAPMTSKDGVKMVLKHLHKRCGWVPESAPWNRDLSLNI